MAVAFGPAVLWAKRTVSATSCQANDEVTTLPVPGRHGDGNNVTYLDGRARRVPISEIIVPLPKSPK
jgi:prepilin-type processing-associated H-X9-DG protein